MTKSEVKVNGKTVEMTIDTDNVSAKMEVVDTVIKCTIISEGKTEIKYTKSFREATKMVQKIIDPPKEKVKKESFFARFKRTKQITPEEAMSKIFTLATEMSD